MRARVVTAPLGSGPDYARAVAIITTDTTAPPLPLAADLDLPSFDHTDATLRGPRGAGLLLRLERST